MRPGFEGGQMPIYMRLGKQRGSTSKDAMPIGPHRTQTAAVNVADLQARFEAGAEVTPEILAERKLIRSTRIDVKILGNGDLTKRLTVTAHLFSKSAREKIEKAGGTATALREPKVRKRRVAKPRPAPAVEEREEQEAAEEREAAEAEEVPTESGEDSAD
jgi:large subunit ribosomal protein L15